MFDGNPLTFSTVPGIFGGNPLTFSKVPSIFDGNPLTIFKSSKHIRWCVALQSSGMFPGIFSLFSSLGPKHTCLCIAPQSSGIFPGIFSLFLESSATMRPFSHRAFYGPASSLLKHGRVSLTLGRVSHGTPDVHLLWSADTQRAWALRGRL